MSSRVLLIGLILAVGCERGGEALPRPTPAAAAPQFVGSARCAGCHAAEAKRWRGSHHDRAMQEADATSLLGDFGGARLEHFGAVSEFVRRGERFAVRSRDGAGPEAELEVAYAFGVDPLQQLLVRGPGGRLQAFGVAWDARPASEGGARWFPLHAEPVPPGDVLHWSMPGQNWNAQCAECHSTSLRKGYDAARDTYGTSASAIDVGCEACHGPGSAHAADPGARLRLPAGAARWELAEGTAIARRVPPRTDTRELDACAPCHARRSTLREGGGEGAPFLDTHRPALLDAGLYEADGQIRDEVYEYGSFVQSPMFAAGVTCSDCHDPHSLALRAEGNALCGQCHRPEVYDAASHHHHAAGSPASRCVSCHMPARTYMVVDVRHDHSFRVPRPDLSLALGTPNACGACHAERGARFAADAVRSWFPAGRSGTPHFASALDAGRRGLPGADAALARVALDTSQPGIVRGTALALLDPGRSPGAERALAQGLADADGLVRLGALEAAERLEPAARPAALAPSLRHPLRAVRVEAARALAGVPAALIAPAQRGALMEGLAEYRAVQALHADLPASHVNLGLLAAALGDADAARRSYQEAMRLAPSFVPAAVNLADLERALGREAEAEAALRGALAALPDSADVHHALGLLLIRTGRRDEAAAELARAAALAPGEVRFAYAHALALRDRGEAERALAVLEEALAQRPHDAELLLAAALFARDLGRRESALRHARALAETWPAAPQGPALLGELEGEGR